MAYNLVKFPFLVICQLDFNSTTGKHFFFLNTVEFYQDELD